MQYTPCSTHHALHTLQYTSLFAYRVPLWLAARGVVPLWPSLWLGAGCPYGLRCFGGGVPLCGWGRGAPMAFAVAREGHGVWGWKRSLVNAPHHTFSHMIQYHPPPSSSTPSTPSRTHARTHIRTHTYTHKHTHRQTHTQTHRHTHTLLHPQEARIGCLSLAPVHRSRPW